MSKTEIIKATLEILKARPDSLKGLRHVETFKWLKEIVLPELKQEGGEG